MNWTKITEQLPPIPPKECGGIRLFIFINNGKQSFSEQGCYTYYGRFQIGNMDVTDHVTHWMRLPTDPES